MRFNRTARLIGAHIIGGGDTTSPTVTITTDEADPTIASPITYRFTWNEAVTGFATGDITVANGTKVTFATVSSSVYTQTVVPNAGATVTVDVNAGVCVDGAGNANLAATQHSVISKVLVWDDFSDTTAAGSLNTSAASPGPGTRAVTDTNNKLSTNGTNLSFATGGAGAGNPGLWYGAVTRGYGMIYVSSFNSADSTKSQLSDGFDNNTAGAVGNGVLFYTGNGIINHGNNESSFPIVGAYASGNVYYVATVLRATGTYTFIKGGAFTNWTLLMAYGVANTATLYPGASVYSGTETVVTKGFLRVFKAGTYDVPVLAYDTFDRSNGALGSSITTGPDGQTITARAWTDRLGTWGVATNVANCSALDGSGVGITTIAATSADVHAFVAVTRAAGAAGLVLRYQDADNYLYAYHDGTNAALIQRVAGVESNVVAPTAKTYAAGGVLLVILEGTAARLMYNNLAVGTGTVPASSYDVHGLWTNNTGPTMNNFTVMSRTGYAGLDSYITNP